MLVHWWRMNGRTDITQSIHSGGDTYVVVHRTYKYVTMDLFFSFFVCFFPTWGCVDLFFFAIWHFFLILTALALSHSPLRLLLLWLSWGTLRLFFFLLVLAFCRLSCAANVLNLCARHFFYSFLYDDEFVLFCDVFVLPLVVSLLVVVAAIDAVAIPYWIFFLYFIIA